MDDGWSAFVSFSRALTVNADVKWKSLEPKVFMFVVFGLLLMADGSLCGGAVRSADEADGPDG